MGDIDDELEAALAEQRAMVAASSVKPGVGPAASSPLGASPVHRVRASLCLLCWWVSGCCGMKGQDPWWLCVFCAVVLRVLKHHGAAWRCSKKWLKHDGVHLLCAVACTQVRQSPLRVTSRMQIENSGLSMSAMPEEVDEEEQAIAAQQVRAPAAA